MAAIDTINAFNWPCDCNEQASAIHTFEDGLNDLIEEWKNLASEVFYFSGQNEPSEAAWRNAWLQAGNTLPLPNNVRLVWIDSDTNTMGGLFTALGNEIYRVERNSIKGATLITEATPVAAIPAGFAAYNTPIFSSYWDAVNLPATGNTTFRTSKLRAIVSSVRPFWFKMRFTTAPASFGFNPIDPAPTMHLHYSINGVLQSPWPNGVMRIHHNSSSRIIFQHPSQLAAGNYTIEFGIILLPLDLTETRVFQIVPETRGYIEVFTDG